MSILTQAAISLVIWDQEDCEWTKSARSNWLFLVILKELLTDAGQLSEHSPTQGVTGKGVSSALILEEKDHT